MALRSRFGLALVFLSLVLLVLFYSALDGDMSGNFLVINFHQVNAETLVVIGFHGCWLWRFR